MILRQNYFAIPAVDIDFLPKEVDPIYTTKTNIGRDAPRHRNAQTPSGLVKTKLLNRFR
jgi:hypothetical protein